MPREVSAAQLQDLLAGRAPFALIDVREAGEYNSSHIPGASLIPRRELEFRLAAALPYPAVPVVLCDDDGRRAALAAATLERLGYSAVSVLARGINGWASADYPTEWGVNVPSKDFGEKMEVQHQVPEIDAAELHRRMERGDQLVILDTRTPEEYRRFCIPGGRSVPGGELALRIADLTADLAADTTVIVNCAGRTRSIIGTRVLQRMGRANVFGLKNGTSGWTLAGYQLESGADRVDLPAPSPAGLAAAEAYADRLAAEDGVRWLDLPGLQELMARRQRETVYLIDVRTAAEYAAGHIPAFRWFPGGQAVQRSDEVAVVKNCPIVFACDGRARAGITASWYRQLGYAEVYALHGGAAAWVESGQTLDTGPDSNPPLGWAAALEQVQLLTAAAVQAAIQSNPAAALIFVDTSADFARSHIPGARWLPRGWLELQIAALAPDKAAPVIVTDTDGANAVLAGAALRELGYAQVTVLDGGMAAWRAAALPEETGLAGVMQPPNDLVPSGPDRSYADAINYLRWETALGEKYAAGGGN